MIIKTFVGDTSAAALKQVRAELGGDAIVLKTCRVPNNIGGYNYEVTACLDKPKTGVTAVSSRKEPATTRNVNAPVWNRLGKQSTPPTVSTTPGNPTAPSVPTPTEYDLSNINTKLDKLICRLDGGQISSGLKAEFIDLDLPTALVNEIVASAPNETQIEKLLLTPISSRLSELPIFQPNDRILVIGPAGSGKTSVVSRLTAQLVTQKMSVTIAGHNQSKVGAIDELASIADLIGVEFPASSGTAIARERSHTVAIIDCGDVSLSAEDLSALSPTHTIFVFSATMRTTDLVTAAEAASMSGVTHVIMTMLDCTHRLGGLFAVCDTLGAGLCLISDSSIGVDSLRPTTADVIISRMLKREAPDAK